MNPVGRCGFSDHAEAFITRARSVNLEGLGDGSSLQVGGVFHVECRDANGNLKWRDTAKNSVTNAGLNDTLNVELHNSTQTATWYIGLVDNAAFSAFAAADTMGSHAGWAESVVYSNSTRVAWGNGAASSQSMTNSSPAAFTINGTATIHGLFLTSVSTKSGSTGTLFSTAAFSGGNQAVASGDTLNVTYTVSATTS